MTKYIKVRGAREHNLKNVNIDIPRDQLVVITGISGSGKSSLAFDTLYAEGQRRYVESLSTYARQFLEMSQKPDVDSIEGLSPAISIEQKTTSKNPRSTVGTVTEIYDYLRLLYARCGIPHSPETGQPISSQTITEMVDRLMELPEGTKLILLAPIVRGRKGEYRKEIGDLRKKGFGRVRIDGKVYEIDQTPELNKNIKHTIEVVVDRLIIKPDVAQRLADTLETILALSEGLAIALNPETGEETLFSANFCCPVSGFTIEEIEPRLFSFNSPHGACPTCDGLGNRMSFDEDLVVPDKTVSLRNGAIAPWSQFAAEHYWKMIDGVLTHFKASASVPFGELPEIVQRAFMHGTEEPIRYPNNYGLRGIDNRPFEGVIPHLERRWRETESNHVRDFLSQFQKSHECETCEGHRLKKEARCVLIDKHHIGQATSLPITGLLTWIQGLRKKFNKKQMSIAERVLKEIEERTQFLVSVGLDYLTLSRTAGTLSGGESQRIRLASQIGSGLTGVLYVLDEPSIGLHQRDNNRLLKTLQRLRDLGNTVLVVEHDQDAMETADWLIDIGPRAGIHGGKVISEGNPAHVKADKNSLTGQYLSGKKVIPVPKKRRTGNGEFLKIKGASLHNLKNVNLEIPLGTFTCVTGVSGSGKSSLILETLYRILARDLNRARTEPGPYKDLSGLVYLDKVVEIDQSPIGRTPRSNPATYTGIFTPIRDWFAGLPEAKARGYKAGRFSFNVKGGRCEACQGDGVIKIEMHFLPDVYVTCDQCKGKRYNRETLEVKYKDKSIADVLEMTVVEAKEFFSAHPMIYEKCLTLEKVGLDYIHLGQRATTLSGGEAQRIKLSKELSKRGTGRTIYILDEPTTGLHFEDVRKLNEVLHSFVEQGNTVLVIEHNLDVIKTADWIIDVGPEGGDKGGKIVAACTPEDLVKVKGSHTGTFLKPYLKK